jgi:WD40 repeat protein
MVYAEGTMRIDRRQFVAGMAGGLALAACGPARAAPFVPARDPQVVAFAPGGTLVATGCSGLTDSSFPPRPHPDVRKCGVVAVWDVDSGKRLFRWETFGDLTKLAFSPDGTLLAASRLFETPDGLSLSEVRVWDVTTGRLTKALDRCHAFDFLPDSRQLAVLSRSKCVLYDLKDWTKETLVKPLGGAVSVASSADGNSLIGIVRDADSYRLRAAAIGPSAAGEAPGVRESDSLDRPFYRLAVATDGALLATGHDNGQIVLWDAITLQPQFTLQCGEPGLAHPFFSRDAKLLAAGCQASGSVLVWDLVERQQIGRYAVEKGSFRTHLSRPADATFRPELDPTRFCFSPDGEAILIGAHGGLLRATRSGQELRRFGD